MRVLVTGSSGKVGRVLVKELLQHNYEVVGLDLKAPEPAQPITFIKADICQREQVESALEGMDAVCHLAAIIDNYLGTPEEIMTTNVMATFYLLKGCVLHGVKKFVFASSVRATGFSGSSKPLPIEYLPIDEDHPCRPDDTYGMSKLVGEILCQGYAHRYDMSIICLRVGGVIAPTPEQPDPKPVSVPLISSIVHVEDVAQAFRLALERPIPFGIYHITSVYRYAEDGSRLDRERHLQDIRDSSAKRVRAEDGFLESKGGVSCARAQRELGYQPRW